MCLSRQRHLRAEGESAGAAPRLASGAIADYPIRTSVILHTQRQVPFGQQVAQVKFVSSHIEALHLLRSTRRSVVIRLLILVSLVVGGAKGVIAQAGSRSPLHFQTTDAFYHSLNSSGSGARHYEVGGPVAPAGALRVADSTRFLLWVELGQGRLNVIENLGDAGLVLRKRIPISIGKRGVGKQVEGDNKTPVGIYRISEYLDDSQLDDFYGLGAYPLDYPNALDRLHRRSGHGIWLHGLPKSEELRPFLASEGCVVIDNTSFAGLAGEVTAGETLILLSTEELEWVPQQELRSAADELQAAIEEWQGAWESLDTEQYLAHYADDFSDLKFNKSSWAKYKKQVNAQKRFIDVELEDFSMLVEPTTPNVVKVLFRQGYRSDNYSWQGRKEQLWRRDGSGWKIIYEGEV